MGNRELRDFILMAIIDDDDIDFDQDSLFFTCRSCFDTLEGHEATVWAISFDKTGDRMGEFHSLNTTSSFTDHF